MTISSEIQELALRFDTEVRELNNTLANFEGKAIPRKLITSNAISKLLLNYQAVFPTLNEQEIRTCLKLAEYETTTAENSTTEGALLLNTLDIDATQHHSWLVLSWLVSSGLFFIYGKPKAGKSAIIYNLIYSVITGTPFLGMPVRQGNVLFYNLEEGRVSMVKKMNENGLFFDDFRKSPHKAFLQNSLDLYNNFPAFKADVEKYDPVLVIIDTARKANINNPNAEKTAEWAQPFDAIHSVCISRGITAIVVHHTNKTKSGESDVYNMAGSGRLPSIGAGSIELVRKSNSPYVNLKFITRDIGEREAVLKRSRDKYKRINLSLYKEQGNDYVELSEYVLHLLYCHGELSEDELQQFTKDKVELAIDRLLDICLISYRIQDNQLLYFIGKSEYKMLSELESYQELLQAKGLIDTLLECSSLEEVKEIYKTKKHLVTKAISLMTVESKFTWIQSIKPPTVFEGFKAIEYNFTTYQYFYVDISNPSTKFSETELKEITKN